MYYVCIYPKALNFKISNKNNENEISQITIINTMMPYSDVTPLALISCSYANKMSSTERHLQFINWVALIKVEFFFCSMSKHFIHVTPFFW